MTKEQIAEIIKLTGLSKAGFGALVGACSFTVSKWVSGKSEPSFVSQKAIRAVFGKEVKKVIG